MASQIRFACPIISRPHSIVGKLHVRSECDSIRASQTAHAVTLLSQTMLPRDWSYQPKVLAATPSRKSTMAKDGKTMYRRSCVPDSHIIIFLPLAITLEFWWNIFYVQGDSNCILPGRLKHSTLLEGLSNSTTLTLLSQCNPCGPCRHSPSTPFSRWKEAETAGSSWAEHISLWKAALFPRLAPECLSLGFLQHLVLQETLDRTDDIVTPLYEGAVVPSTVSSICASLVFPPLVAAIGRGLFAATAATHEAGAATRSLGVRFVESNLHFIMLNFPILNQVNRWRVSRVVSNSQLNWLIDLID